MLPTILKKRMIVFLIGIFGIIGIFSLSIQSKPSSPELKQNKTYATDSTTVNNFDSSSLKSDSFKNINSVELKKILLINDLLRETGSYLTCQALGVEPINPNHDCIKTLASNYPNKGELFKNSGILYITSASIGSLYTPPASSKLYASELINNFGIEKKATAQSSNSGNGFTSLKQIQDIWILFRNIVYLLLVVIFVLIGVLIMLRINIDPRTVMTIQNQIPKAIVAIVLITFSYSIAGFLVDTMWVGTYFGVNLLTETQPPCNVGGEKKTLTSVVTQGLLNNPVGFTSDILGDETGCQGTIDGITGLSLTIGRTLGDIIARSALAVFGLNEDLGDCGGENIPIVGKLFGDGNLQNCFKIAFFSILKYFISIASFLIVFLAIIAALFRVWFSLLKSYIFLLIDITLAPFWILMGLIPGSTLSFTGWVRSIFAQLAVFPTTALLLVMASVITRNPTINNPGEGVFLPPLIGNPNIADNLGALIAFGFILLTPDIGNIVRDALKSPASKATGGITAGFAAATGKVMGSGKDISERISKRNDIMLEKRGEERGLFRIPIFDKKIG